jgi:hypothetical protein
MRADTVDGNCAVVGGMDGYLAVLTGHGGGQVVDMVCLRVHECTGVGLLGDESLVGTMPHQRWHGG